MKLNKIYIIYFNYSLSFLGSIFFIIFANYLNLENIDKYIFILSLSAVFASSIYSSSIKSKLEEKIIIINLTKNSLKALGIIYILILFYLFFKENYFLSIFLTFTILYETCLNLFAISFIKRNETFKHSKFLVYISILKNLCLTLSVFFINFLYIVLIFYLIFVIVFISKFKSLGVIFKQNSKPFNLIDLFYVITGSLIFQIDKIIGESILDKSSYITYFLIFKFASLFQVVGSLLTQPLRNVMISSEKVSLNLNKKLIINIFLIFLLIIFSNIFLFLMNKVEIFNIYIFEINLVNIAIFNFFAISILFHVYSGFFIDALFINNKGKILFITNLVILSLIIFFLMNFESLLLWSATMFSSQLIMLILFKIIYMRYVR